MTTPARRGCATALEDLLLRQDDVVTWSQLHDLGLPDATVARLVRGWDRVLPGVYVAGPVRRPMTFRQQVRAGCLYAGEGARLRGRAAAYVQGLTDEPPEVVEVLIPWTRRTFRRHPQLRIVRERAGVRLPALASDPPTTRVEDTVLDLCDESGERECLTWLTRACQRRLTTAPRLLERMRGRKRLRHRELMHDILRDVAGGVHSHLEHRWVAAVEVPHGLPPLARQHVIPETGHPADGYHVVTRTVLELDGRQFHREERQFRDNRLEARHAAAGYGTFRTDWLGVTVEACETVRSWAAYLRSRGWAGELSPCPRCSTRAR